MQGVQANDLSAAGRAIQASANHLFFDKHLFIFHHPPFLMVINSFLMIFSWRQTKPVLCG
jgi:hypothetical protein